MMENKSVDLPVNPAKNRSKNREQRQIRINLYLTPSEFSEYAAEAEKTGLRPKQAKLFTQKPHGFEHEKIPNTKGIARLIRKFLFPSWKRTEAERLIKRRELEKEAETLGLKIHD